MMLDKIIPEEKKEEVFIKEDKNFKYYEKFDELIWIDFNKNKNIIKLNLKESAKPISHSIYLRTDEIEKYIVKDETRWYDVLSVGIAKAIRKTDKYDIYRVDIYEKDRKEIKSGELYDKLNLAKKI